MDKHETATDGFRDKLRRLAGIVLVDADLQGVVDAWPAMSEQAKHICTKLAGMTDDD